MNRKLSRLLEPSMALYFILVLLFAAAALYLQEYYLALGEGVALALVFTLYQISAARRRQRLLTLARETSASLETVTRGDGAVPIPMAVLKCSNQEIIWGNEIFYRAIGLTAHLFETKLTDVVPDFRLDWLQTLESQAPEEIILPSGRYRVFGNLLQPDGDDPTALLAAVYFVELTDLFQVRDEYRRTRPAVCIILVDNYDELTNALPDSKVSALSAAIGQRISDWLAGENGSLHELSRNRYLFFCEEQNLARLRENRFTILDDIREVKNPSGIAATVSVGIGREGSGFAENFAFATKALEMCMYRGGDQVVLKGTGDENYTYFGGRTKEGEHRTSVRARVIAASLKTLLEGSDSIFIMGHSYADYDAVGAAAGVCCMCRILRPSTPVYILYSEQNAAQGLVDLLRQQPEYTDVFISAQEALLRVERKSLLVVVDTNRPEQCQSQELLESMLQVNRVAVIDHHRRAADFIEPCVLAFHEPSASSASELVTEMLQHAVASTDILPAEAEALLTGIVLDTKQFSSRTGARTFESAAYLRQVGADPSVVKQLFQSNFPDTLAKQRIVGAAFLYRRQIAVSVQEQTVDQIIAAQAADALLNVQGVSSSFVLYPVGDQVKISARSLSGSHNVQMILEPLGGGGNQETAAALVGASKEDALKQLCRCIDRYLDQPTEPDAVPAAVGAAD